MQDVRAVAVHVGGVFVECKGGGRPLVGRDVPVGGCDASAGGLVELLEVDVAGILLEIDHRVGVVRGRHVEEAPPPHGVGHADLHDNGIGTAVVGEERGGDRNGEVLVLRDRHGAVAGGEPGEDGGVGDGRDLADARDGRRARGADDGVQADRGMEEVRAAVPVVIERQVGEQAARRRRRPAVVSEAVGGSDGL